VQYRFAEIDPLGMGTCDGLAIYGTAKQLSGIATEPMPGDEALQGRCHGYEFLVKVMSCALECERDTLADSDAHGGKRTPSS